MGVGRVAGLFVGGRPGGGVLSFQLVLGGLFLNGRRLWFDSLLPVVQILAIVWLKWSWLLLGVLGGAPGILTYFILFGRKIILTLWGVQRLSNHDLFGIFNSAPH